MLMLMAGSRLRLRLRLRLMGLQMGAMRSRRQVRDCLSR